MDSRSLTGSLSFSVPAANPCPRQGGGVNGAGCYASPYMGGEMRPFDGAEAASLIGWWLDAGVDTPIAEAPRNWLQAPMLASPPLDGRGSAPSADPTRPAEPRPFESGGEPATLEAFHLWLRQASDLPLFHAGAARALPHGPAEAPIMLVSDLPTRDCAAEGRSIGGEAWALTTRMLAAIGFAPEQAYVASLACFPAPGQRLDAANLAQCAQTMRRHIALVRPKRLLLFGDGPARALLAQSVIQARGRIHRLDGIPLVATFHPRQLLGRPSDKAHAWRDLQTLMSEEVS